MRPGNACVTAAAVLLAACDAPVTGVATPTRPSVALAVSDGPPPPQFAPYTVDPGRTGRATARWLRYAGEPDGGGVPQHALLLELTAGVQKGAEVGAQISNVKGIAPPREIGFDVQDGATCDANGPQVVMTMSDRSVYTFDCAKGKAVPSPIKGATGWTRVQFGLPVSWPAGVTLDSVRIMFRYRGVPVHATIGSFTGIVVNPGWPGLRLYVADTDSNRVVRIGDVTSTGSIGNITTFGARGSGVGQFNAPMDVSVDQTSRIYVADMNNDRVARINDMTGLGWATVSGPPVCTGLTGAAELCKPTGLVVHGSSQVFVTTTKFQLVTFDMSAPILTASPSAGTVCPVCVTTENDVFVDQTGRIYRGHFIAPGLITRYADLSGVSFINYQYWPAPGLNGTRTGPAHLFVDAWNRIFIADGCRVYRLDDMAGTGRVFFPAGTACFGSGLTSVGTDQFGRVYFTAPDSSGVWHIFRMNDMTGAGLVQLPAFTNGVLRGLWVDDREPLS